MGDRSATDVITFPLEETISGLLDGEIVISVKNWTIHPDYNLTEITYESEGWENVDSVVK